MTITMAAAVTLKAGQLVSGTGIATGTKVASDTTTAAVVIDTQPSGTIAAGSTLTFSTPAGPDGCLVCPAGSFSPYGQKECSQCVSGRYAESEESMQCTACGTLS